MSEITVAPDYKALYDAKLIEVAQLQQQLDEIRSEKSKPKNRVVAAAKKFGASVVAVFSTPDAIKAEKSLAVVALGRAAILVPSAAVLIDIAVKAIQG